MFECLEQICVSFKFVSLHKYKNFMSYPVKLRHWCLFSGVCMFCVCMCSLSNSKNKHWVIFWDKPYWI